jgi:hypothetical protein
MLTTLHSAFTTDTAVHLNCTAAHQDRVLVVGDHTEAHLGTDLEVGDRC